MSSSEPSAPRRIANTSHHTTRPWPADIEIQGGNGWASSKGFHDEWFFEAFPPGTFMRGTGPTLAEAEAQVWNAYQRMLACPAAPVHGPYEARTFTNGSGYCTRCGTWFSHVLPPQEHHPLSAEEAGKALANFLHGKGVPTGDIEAVLGFLPAASEDDGAAIAAQTYRDVQAAAHLLRRNTDTDEENPTP